MSQRLCNRCGKRGARYGSDQGDYLCEKCEREMTGLKPNKRVRRKKAKKVRLEAIQQGDGRWQADAYTAKEAGGVVAISVHKSKRRALAMARAAAVTGGYEVEDE